MSNEVRAMIDARHQAEQRGHYELLGRLLSIETAHGVIQFPAERGEWAGPDLGIVCAIGGEVLKVPMDAKLTTSPSDTNILVILGDWRGLPPLRETLKTPRLRNGKPVFTGEDGRSVPAGTSGANQVFDHVPCRKCLHVCDVCDGKGTKACENLDCGGRGWISGFWISCPGPGCHKDKKQFKADCATCATSPIRGQIRERQVCPECEGEKIMRCSGCMGTGKRATGHKNGSLDYRVGACGACNGTGRKGRWVPQELAKFCNAELADVRSAKNGAKWKRFWRVLGPIHSFTLDSFGGRGLRSFEVMKDSAGDYLQLLVPSSVRQRPQKAYLVGGVVRERGA
jgi:hypothetical protein